MTSLIYTYAARFKIRIYRASVAGGRIELLAKAHERKNLADFLRVLAGRVAILITGARKNRKKTGKFWEDLCWSKLVNWGGEFFRVRQRIASLQEEGLPGDPSIPGLLFCDPGGGRSIE